MNFFKKIFSKKQATQNDTVPQMIYTEEYFNQRFVEEDLKSDPIVFEGHLKLIEGYFIDMEVEKPIDNPINHPKNLDKTFDSVITFKLYCNGFQLEDNMVAFALSSAISDFFITKYGFKLYKDKTPEYPLRFLSLKYNKNGVQLSLYPFEYSVKVMNLEATFEDLENRIKDKLEVMPEYENMLNNIKNFGK